MQFDDANEMTIRNHRYSRWPAIAVTSMLAAFFTGICGLTTLDAWLPVVLLIVAATIASLAGAIGLGLFAPHIVTGLSLTDVLQPRPGGPGFVPTEILRIDFGPDPGEDYDDSPSPIMMCEVRVRPVHRRTIRLIASVGDGRRLRDWAVRNGIDVLDPTNVLNEIPHSTE